ncbi:MAG: transcription elongation factor GreA [Candidatus Berkelbacteria bacterium]|nr:transcription elongation factor GreA [Candidatus Berkelbacteria bacterium]
MEKLLITKNGLKKLGDELNYLKTVKRKEIARRIEEAKEYGDISESSEYEDAKNEQALIESRIAELEAMIKNSSLIRNSRTKDRVGYGSIVRVLINNSIKTFKIVGSAESDPAKGFISCNSPIAKALFSLKKGDSAEVKAPNRIIHYKILEIE